MRNARFVMVALGCGAALAAAQPATAQVKGTGKLGITIIRWDDGANAPVSGKAAGSYATKPKLGVTGMSPTGGAVTTLKLPFQAGATIDPLKPGFPTGDYVLQIETSQTPTGNATDAGSAVSYVVLHMDGLGKCTVDPNPTVDGDAGTDWCKQAGNPPCAGPITGKCTFTTYQVAGSLAPLAPGSGQPSASRILLRKKVPAGNCLSGDLNIGGTEVRANDAGSFDPVNHDCADGAVVGVVGVANGATGY
jgi:hypothetical protein